MSSYKERVMKRIPDRPKTGIRAKASGLVGRGKGDSSNGPTTVARPISSLRDPASFAPPPRRTGAGLAPAPPPSSPDARRKVITAPSKYQDPRGEAVKPPPKISADPALQEYQQPQQLLLEDHEYEEPPPKQPYRTDSTGLRTDHLPPPPGRRDGADGRGQPADEMSTALVSKRPPPSLPPRLPARGAARSPLAGSPANPPSGQLNQGAVNRLGAAGVSVPGFGIGSSSPGNASSPSPPPPPRQARTPNAQVDELQNRFSKLGTSSTPSNSSSEGTTWAQKQAALKTASSFQKDPSTVSLADAKSAASTANNFRQRHGEQAAAGVKSANNLNQKYGVMDKVGGYAGRLDQQGPTGQATGGQAAGPPAVPGLAGKKKPPPPPPKKKPALMAAASAGPDDGAPPPIPMSTRPAF